MTPEVIQSIAQWGLAGALAVFLVVRLAKSNSELGKIIARKDDQLLAIMEDHDNKREQGQTERLAYERQQTELTLTALNNNTQALTELKISLNGGRR